MPVRKFRSVEEMSKPQWRTPGDPELYRAIQAVWDFGEKTACLHFRPGVYRYRTIEEMQAGLERIRLSKSAGK
jgi:hypothetical protein